MYTDLLNAEEKERRLEQSFNEQYKLLWHEARAEGHKSENAIAQLMNIANEREKNYHEQQLIASNQGGFLSLQLQQKKMTVYSYKVH